jgi:hypothetical protein
MMPAFIRKFAAPFHYLFARINVFVASRLKPHPLALKHFGIRIVAARDYGSQDNQDEVYSALVLLKQFDEDEFNLVKKNIRTIFLHDMLIFGVGYQPTGQMFVFDIRNLSACPSGTLPIAIAGYLVYFASVAENLLGVEFKEMKKINAEEKQQQIVEKLLKSLPDESF